MKIRMSGKIYYRPGVKYQLVTPWWVQTPFLGMAARIESGDPQKPWVQLDNDGQLHVAAGYSWDGASGPTIDSPSVMRAALMHDACYQLGRAGKLDHEMRSKIDDFFYEMLRQDGMWWWRAKWWRRMVGAFAGFAYKRQREERKSAP